MVIVVLGPEACFAGHVPLSGDIDSYLICGTPRTGSTLLCGLLRSTGIAGRPESYFRLHDEDSYAERWRIARKPDGSFDYLDYVRAAISTGTTENGVFAARVMWGTLDEMIGKLRSSHCDATASDLQLLDRVFGRIRFLHLRREDALAQAVSWVRAEQTDYWQEDDTVSRATTPFFDAKAIQSCVTTIREHNRAWRTWFRAFGIQPLAITYEDLVADVASVTRAILEFLGLQLPIDQLITPGDRQQADQLNHEWIERYRALYP
jgi:LPS sulfotransferase NodH